MWDLASAWEGFGGDLETLAARLTAEAANFAQAIQGQAGDKLNQLLAVDMHHSAVQLKDQADAYAKMLRNAGADIQKTKIMIIGMLAILAATIAMLLASLFGSFAVPSVIAAARVGIGALLRSLIARLMEVGLLNIARELAMKAVIGGIVGAGFMVGFDSAIQGVQIVQGHRDGFDTNALKGAAIGGAIGGALGGLAEGLAGALGKIGRDIWNRLPRSVRAFGPLANTMLQIPAAVLSNPIINKATHSPGGAMEGIFGAIDGGGHAKATVPHVEMPGIKPIGSLALAPLSLGTGAGTTPVPAASSVGATFGRPGTVQSGLPSWLGAGGSVRQGMMNGPSTTELRAVTAQGGAGSIPPMRSGEMTASRGAEPPEAATGARQPQVTVPVQTTNDGPAPVTSARGDTAGTGSVSAPVQRQAASGGQETRANAQRPIVERAPEAASNSRAAAAGPGLDERLGAAFGVDETGGYRRVEPDQVRVAPLTHGSRQIGLNFHDGRESGRAQQWAEESTRGKTVTYTHPGNGQSRFPSRSGAEKASAPWSADSVFVAVPGSADSFDVRLADGARVRLDGPNFARLVSGVSAFQQATGNGSLVLLSNRTGELAGPGGAAHDFGRTLAGEFGRPQVVVAPTSEVHLRTPLLGRGGQTVLDGGGQWRAFHPVVESSAVESSAVQSPLAGFLTGKPEPAAAVAEPAAADSRPAEPPAPGAVGDAVLEAGRALTLPRPFVESGGRSLGVGEVVEVRAAPTRTADPGALVSAAPLRDLVAGLLPPGAAYEPVLAKVGQLVRAPGKADLPDVMDVRKLFGDGLVVSVGRGALAEDVRVRFRLPVDTDGSPDFSRALHVPDAGLLPLGEGERHWFDHDSKAHADTAAEVSGSVEVTATAAASAPKFGGGVSLGLSGSATHAESTVANQNLSSVRSVRGQGEWASFDVPAELVVSREPAHRDAPATESALPVDVRVAFPREMSPRPAAEGPVVAVPDAVGPGLFVGANLAPEAVDLGRLTARVLELVPPRDRVSGSDARVAIESLVSEPDAIRFFNYLPGEGRMSARFELAGSPSAVSLSVVARRVQRLDETHYRMESQDKTQVMSEVARTKAGGVGVPLGGTIGPKWTPHKLSEDQDLGGELRGGAHVQVGNSAAETVIGTGVSYPKKTIEYEGEFVRYRVEVDFHAKLLSGLPRVDGTVITEPGVVYAAVPQWDAARFEDLVANRVDEPVEDVSAAVPSSLRHGVGLGGAHVDQFGGAERVLPQALRLLEQVRSRHGGSEVTARRSEDEIALRKQWESVLSPGAMRANQEALFGSGLNAPRVVRRASAHWHEVVRAWVRAVPSGPMREVPGSDKLELTYGAEQWSIDLAAQNLGSTLRVGGSASAMISFGEDLRPGAPSTGRARTVGFTLGGGRTWSNSVGTVQGTWSGVDPFYAINGPTRAFESPVTYQVRVEVAWEPVSTAGLLGRAVAGVRQLWGGSPEAGVTIADSVDLTGGRSRFLIPEALTSAEPAPAVRTPGPDGPLPAAENPRDVPGTAASVPTDAVVERLELAASDKILEVTGLPRVREMVHRLLDRIGDAVSVSSVARDLVDGALSSGNARVAMRRLKRPGGVVLALPTEVGLVVDSQSMLRIEAIPVGSQPHRNTGTSVEVIWKNERQAWSMRSVTHSRGVGKDFSAGVNAGGVIHRHRDGETIQDTTMVPGFVRGRSSSVTVSDQYLDLTRTGERVSYPASAHDLGTADVVWRATVVTSTKNSLGRWSVSAVADAVRVSSGLSYLRPRADIPGARPGDGLPNLPGTGLAGSSTVDLAAPDGHGSMLVADRLRALIGQVRPPGLDGAWTSIEAPLGGELVRRSPGQLAPAGRRLPQRLADLVSLESLEAYVPAMLGGGVRTRLSAGSGPGYRSGGIVSLQATPAGPYRHVGLLEKGSTVDRHDLRIERFGRLTTKSVTHSRTLNSAFGTGGVGDRLNSPGEALGVNAARTDSTSTEPGAEVFGTYGAFGAIGEQHVYEGELRVDISVRPTLTLSRLANVALLGAPDYVAHRFGGGNAVSDTVTLRHRVVVPHVLAPARDALPAGPAEHTVALAAPPVRSLRPSARAIATNGVVMVDFDPLAVRRMQELVMHSLSQGPAVVAALTRPESLTHEMIRDTLNVTNLRAHADQLVIGDHYRYPLGSSPGTVADVVGDLRVEGWAHSPTVVGWSDALQLDLPIFVDEEMSSTSMADRAGVGISQGAAGKSPGAHDWTFPVSARASTSTSTSQGQRSVVAHGRIRLLPRNSTYLVVKADFSVRATVDAHGVNRVKDRITPGGESVTVRMDNAALIAVSWDEARRMGIRHPDGELTHGGWYLPPEPGEQRIEHEENRARNAHHLPAYDGWTVVSGQAGPDGTLMLRGRSLDPAGLGDLLARNLDPSRQQKPIVLVADRAGMPSVAGVVPPAQQIADTLGVPVIAPQGTPVQTRNGAILSRAWDDGTVPGEPAPWTLFTPGEAPRELHHELTTAMASVEAAASVPMSWRPPADDAAWETRSRYAETETASPSVMKPERPDRNWTGLAEAQALRGAELARTQAGREARLAREAIDRAAPRAHVPGTDAVPVELAQARQQVREASDAVTEAVARARQHDSGIAEVAERRRELRAAKRRLWLVTAHDMEFTAASDAEVASAALLSPFLTEVSKAIQEISELRQAVAGTGLHAREADVIEVRFGMALDGLHDDALGGRLGASLEVLRGSVRQMRELNDRLHTTGSSGSLSQPRIRW